MNRDGTELAMKAVTAYDHALREIGERAELRHGRALAHLSLARGGRLPSAPALAAADRALADLDVAVEFAPESVKYLRTRAVARSTLGMLERALGRDPRATLQAGVADVEAACALAPDDPDARQDAAVVALARLR